MNVAAPSPAKVPALPSVAEVAGIAKSLFPGGSVLRRKMQQLRPYACPMNVLLSLVPESGSVLDVGCGCGLFLGLALRWGHRITAIGLDISESAIHSAIRMRQTGLNEEQRSRLTFRHVRTIDDWPSATYDMVSIIDVIHHVPVDQQAAVLQALAARVKPGGILLYKDMARRPRWRAFLNWAHDLFVSSEWIHYYPVSAVEAIAERAGFVELRAETINCLWYSHELRLYQRISNL
jgi:2-polyprenyl-3-methyl-5-hydroxy-6-metoxy-1,4-benzoquinol methylase